MELEVIVLVVLSSIALFAAIGGSISHVKNRKPLEGFFLGAFLGPIGVVVAARMSFGHRPMIDPGAWNSFRSLVDYQTDMDMVQLPAPVTQSKSSR